MKWNMDGYGCWIQSSPDSSSSATNYRAFTRVQSMEMSILSFTGLSVELAQMSAGLGLWFAACHSADHRQAVQNIKMVIQASRASQLQFTLAKSPSCIPFISLCVSVLSHPRVRSHIGDVCKFIVWHSEIVPVLASECLSLSSCPYYTFMKTDQARTDVLYFSRTRLTPP